MPLDFSKVDWKIITEICAKYDDPTRHQAEFGIRFGDVIITINKVDDVIRVDFKAAS